MKPWFRYTFIGGLIRFWWPCHWLGVFVMAGSVVTIFGVFLVGLHALPHHPEVGFLLSIASAVPWGILGAKHAEEWRR